MWVVPHLIYGTNKYAIKLDLRLTLPNLQTTLSGRILDGVFTIDVLPFPLYCSSNMIAPTTFEETYVAGSNLGYSYTLYNSLNDAGSGVDFQFETKYLDLGLIGVTKRIHKIIVWVENTGDATLTLDWWTIYKTGIDDRGTQTVKTPIAASESYWDEGAWDSAYWDDTVKSYSPIVFNLQTMRGTGGGTEGDCIKLKFSQSSANVKTVIAGFSIIFSKLGLRK
jgi:hypothetical protein